MENDLKNKLNDLDKRLKEMCNYFVMSLRLQKQMINELTKLNRGKHGNDD